MTVVTDEVFCKSQEPATKRAKPLNRKSFRDLKLLHFKFTEHAKYKVLRTIATLKVLFSKLEKERFFLKKKRKRHQDGSEANRNTYQTRGLEMALVFNISTSWLFLKVKSDTCLDLNPLKKKNVYNIHAS